MYIRARRTYASIQARKILAKLGINEPPVDPLWVAKRLGFKIKVKDLNDMDGFAVKTQKGYTIFLSYNPFETRQNFTLAHEIAHIVLGHFNVEDPNDVQLKIMDTEANQFAAELLMSSIFVKQAATRYAVEMLADYFGVSKSAMRIRLENLKII